MGSLDRGCGREKFNFEKMNFKEFFIKFSILSQINLLYYVLRANMNWKFRFFLILSLLKINLSWLAWFKTFSSIFYSIQQRDLLNMVLYSRFPELINNIVRKHNLLWSFNSFIKFFLFKKAKKNFSIVV